MLLALATLSALLVAACGSSGGQEKGLRILEQETAPVPEAGPATWPETLELELEPGEVVRGRPRALVRRWVLLEQAATGPLDLSVLVSSRSRRWLAMARDRGAEGFQLLLAERESAVRYRVVAQGSPGLPFSDWPEVSEDGQVLLAWSGDALRRWVRRGERLEPAGELHRGAVKYWPALAPDGQRWAARAIFVGSGGGPRETLLVDGVVRSGEDASAVGYPVFGPDGRTWACVVSAPAGRILLAGRDGRVVSSGLHEELGSPSPDAASGGLRARARSGGRTLHVVVPGSSASAR